MSNKRLNSNELSIKTDDPLLLQKVHHFAMVNRVDLTVNSMDQIQTLEARIKELELQLKEANEVAEFYGDEKNWKARGSGHGDQTYDSIANDCEYGGTAGKRARSYLRKWKGEK